ncbi:hypothetical protein IJG89_01910 [Candidatus Saccharibacteria bacterium]|nr:hypothetical protein [Candidatus Saccharibacteria bacterium]
MAKRVYPDSSDSSFIAAGGQSDGVAASAATMIPVAVSAEAPASAPAAAPAPKRKATPRKAKSAAASESPAERIEPFRASDIQWVNGIADAIVQAMNRLDAHEVRLDKADQRDDEIERPDPVPEQHVATITIKMDGGNVRIKMDGGNVRIK